MTHAALLALLIGFAAATSAIIVREFVPALWLLRRPFSCDLCMSWWMSVGLYVFDLTRAPWPVYNPPLVVLAATLLSIVLLKVVNRLSEVTFAPSHEATEPPHLASSSEEGDTHATKEFDR